MGRLNDASPSGGGGDLVPGDFRTVYAKDKSGNILKTITIVRTDRPYVFDLRDAYNEARSATDAARGVEWYVNTAGELKIGFSADSTRREMREAESRLETERARYIRHHLENHRQQEPAETA